MLRFYVIFIRSVSFTTHTIMIMYALNMLNFIVDFENTVSSRDI